MILQVDSDADRSVDPGQGVEETSQGDANSTSEKGADVTSFGGGEGGTFRVQK